MRIVNLLNSLMGEATLPSLTTHFDNLSGFNQPLAIVKSSGDDEGKIVSPSGQDEYGFIYEFDYGRKKKLALKFLDETDHQHVENDSLWRMIPVAQLKKKEVWCRGWNAFVYNRQPRIPGQQSAAKTIAAANFVPGVYVSETGGRFGLGASVLTEGGVWFGFFHPHAARVFVVGEFNDWQHPGQRKADQDQFLEMQLYRGYFDVPNVWLLKVDRAQIGQKYKFYVEHNILTDGGVWESVTVTDPYARALSHDYEQNESLIVDPSRFEWSDQGFQTPQAHDLILYELHAHGFTQGHHDVDPEHQGRFAGVTDRINAGYFDRLGVTALSFLPLTDSPTPQGEQSLGYDPSLFFALERDFGSPDEFRTMVNAAHNSSLAVIVDEVFNHTSNGFNPLWRLILEHPLELNNEAEGGLYFSGGSPWGNRLATERTETQNMLIDACKLMLVEYHVDGFRFDFTHSSIMDHGFLHRLADEVRTVKPDTILIAENMPNESDLNRKGYDGFAQWCDQFHDGVKALLREGEFEGFTNHPARMGDIFYFSKSIFAAHTNNVVNYCESHDEHSVPHEVSFVGSLNSPAAKERKARLGMFATMVALGQPMIYMGQEFASERPRNHVYFDFPQNPQEHGFFRWASGLIGLRRRYPGLKLNGYNPLEEGEFTWLLGPWLDGDHGGGKRILGWRATPNANLYDHLVILMNFENHSVEVDVDFGTPGSWVRLATIDSVTDIPPAGDNSVNAETTLHLPEGIHTSFVLPDSSGFIYKWEAGL